MIKQFDAVSRYQEKITLANSKDASYAITVFLPISIFTHIYLVLFLDHQFKTIPILQKKFLNLELI